MESSTTNDVAQDLSESLWNESDPLNPLITVFAVLSFQILPMSVPIGLSATCLFACRACLLIWSSQAYYLSVCRFVAVSAHLHIQWHASWAAQRFQIRQRCHAHRITSHNYTLVTLLDRFLPNFLAFSFLSSCARHNFKCYHKSNKCNKSHRRHKYRYCF